MRTYGEVRLIKKKVWRRGKHLQLPFWSIVRAEPHVCIKLKSVFEKISKTQTVPYDFDVIPQNSHDLLWFMQRYPLDISASDLKMMQQGSRGYISDINQLEKICSPDYTALPVVLNAGLAPRNYQLSARDIWLKKQRLLIGDDMGLGKTLSAILGIMQPQCRPAMVVCQSHLPDQWEYEISKYTTMTVHKIKVTKPYDLPPADIYIFKYSCLSGWVDYFKQGVLKTAVFDEVQELRRVKSQKYEAARVISESVDFCAGLSGTPIFNYGDEIFNILDVINPGCLGGRDAFLREWCAGGEHVKDTKALGTFLRENFLMLRRSRKDVGRELPQVSRIIQYVGYDYSEVQKVEQIAKMLAIKFLSSDDYVEKGQAAADLNWRLREATGVAKARYVAGLVQIIIDSGEPVMLTGWHRAVYDIWLKELKQYNPVMYTGSESIRQKNEALRAFMAGESKVFIISNRSGVGLNGLQEVCSTGIICELDWSPQVHNQLVTRLDRDGQKNPVQFLFPVTDWGSDPVIMDVLGLKSSQAHNIINPLDEMEEKFSDESRMVSLAKGFLKSINVPIPEKDSKPEMIKS